MSKPQKPYNIRKRKDAKTFFFTLNPPCGLPERVCREWQRISFQNLPFILARFRNPKSKTEADIAVHALISYLKERLQQCNMPTITIRDISVGAWIEKFIFIDSSPRTGINIARNRPYSIKTIKGYESYYRCHIKSDQMMMLKMSDVEEADILAFTGRIGNKTVKNGQKMSQTRTFEGILKFIRMAFTEYQRTHRHWANPFQGLNPPQRIISRHRGALTENEVVSLFAPGVLQDTMELAICSVMFLSGLRRAEIFALKPDCLDWHTPKILVRNAWQRFDTKDKVLGPPKGKRERDAPFDPILQQAIKKLWEENGKHEFVFSFKDGRTPGPSWIKGRFPKWLERAGIKLEGRKIVPHSARHSLASLLEARGVSIRYIQELLGHSDLTTTKIYLHSTDKTISDVGKRITEIMDEKYAENIVDLAHQ